MKNKLIHVILIPIVAIIIVLIIAKIFIILGEDFKTGFLRSLGTAFALLISYLILMSIKSIIILWFPISYTIPLGSGIANEKSMWGRFRVFFNKIIHRKFHSWYADKFGKIDWHAVANELEKAEKHSEDRILLTPISDKKTQRFISFNEKELETYEGIGRLKRIMLLLELEQITEGVAGTDEWGEHYVGVTLFELTLKGLENNTSPSGHNNKPALLVLSHQNRMKNEYYGKKRDWWKKILSLKITELPSEPYV